MELSKNIKFNFFNKKESQPVWKKWLAYNIKRAFFLSNFFFVLPTLAYKLLVSVPELKSSLPALLETVSANSYISISLLFYALYMMYDSCKDLVQEDGQKLNKNFGSVFAPIFLAIEFSIILSLLSPLWAIMWPIIR